MTTPEPPEENCEQQWGDLLFGVRRSVRYNIHRRRFFDHLHTLTSAIAVIFGSATFVSLLQFDKKYALVAAGVVTVMSTFDLVIGFARKANMYEALARRFTQLEKQMVATPTRDRGEDAIARFTAARLDIEADEPPVNRMVDTIAHNELAHAMGCDDSELYKISLVQRLLANFFPVRLHKLKKAA